MLLPIYFPFVKIKPEALHYKITDNLNKLAEPKMEPVLPSNKQCSLILINSKSDKHERGSNDTTYAKITATGNKKLPRFIKPAKPDKYCCSSSH